MKIIRLLNTGQKNGMKDIQKMEEYLRRGMNSINEILYQNK